MHNKSILKFKNKLASLDPNKEDIVHTLYELVDLIEKIDGSEIVIPDILKYMETYPLLDLGSPGPLVHFIESHYPGYMELLISSVNSNPTIHTLWMINRILNSNLENNIRVKLISILETIKNDKNQLPVLREDANEYYEHQHSKNS